MIEYRVSVMYEGFDREYVVLTNNNKKKKRPLIIVLHGAGESYEDLLKYTNFKFNEYACKLGFCLLYPRAYEDHWNDGRYRVEEADDISYIEFVINDVSERENIDKNMIFLVGFSRGGIFAHTFVTMSNIKIKGFATVASAVSVNLMKPSIEKDTDVLMINGVQDGVINYYGSEKSKTLSAKNSLGFWLWRYKGGKVKIIEKSKNEDIKYIFCPEYPNTILIESKTGKHSWTLKNNFNSIDKIMEFFKLL